MQKANKKKSRFGKQEEAIVFFKIQSLVATKRSPAHDEQGVRR